MFQRERSGLTSTCASGTLLPMVRRAAAGIVLVSGLAMPAAAPQSRTVRVWAASLQLPTSVEGPANPNPPFDLFAFGRFNYPYPIRDALTDRRETVTWRTLHLENEYLRLTVLPDLGGHIYSSVDKRTGREMFYANTAIKKALIFVTSKYVAALDAAIDVWSSGPKGFSLDRVASERARGRQYWFYNGGRPAGGAITIDAPATDARATIWAAFKHDVSVYFYWYAVHWRHNSQKQGERNQNVWADTITFDNRKQANKSVDDQGYIHGDGVLMYPGEERLHPAEDRGIAGPIGTVQVANFRRGLQDHQYLTMARSLGLNGAVDEALVAIVPRVFSDAGSRVSFPETGAPYESARLRLARAIAATAKK